MVTVRVVKVTGKEKGTVDYGVQHLDTGIVYLFASIETCRKVVDDVHAGADTIETYIPMIAAHLYDVEPVAS